MLFNSIEFLVFLIVVFASYWFIFAKKIKLQNLFILVVSYIFYGWWDWKFLSLIFISSVVDYIVGLELFKTEIKKKRKLLLIISIIVNLGFLGFFKYYNFFIDSFIDAFAMFSINIEPSSLNIILPVGISFYTFQTLSYTIDIYKKQLEPTKDLIAFFAFVSFFPQLVAGPIERAKNLLPQFYVKRKFDYLTAADGMKQILYGFFKKIVIADGASKIVNEIFSNSDAYGSWMLWLGIIFFAFQIYGDFSGYSDIAIGTAKLFGFKLMRNFALPYFSRNIAEFWQRWHISLSTWFRDYVYIPLGGSFVGKSKQIRNIIITFTISGFWHGANWTFVVWGLLNGLYYIPIMLAKKQKKYIEIVAKNRLLPKLKDLINIKITFLLTLIAWVFFRAENIKHAFIYIKGMFSTIVSKTAIVELYDYVYWNEVYYYMFFLLSFIIFEWFTRMKQHGLENLKMHIAFRWIIYFIFTFIILSHFEMHEEKEFIYFQF